jgi:Cdc6-like AAA superfamily ATPase
VDQLNRKQDDKDRVEILEWLTPIDYAPEQDNFIKRRQPGTGQWLLDSQEFHDWLKTSGQILFCPGDPGVGKTILSSVVIDDLHLRYRKWGIQDEENVGIAYIYCNFNRTAEQQAQDLITNLLKQLAHDRPSLPGCVKTLHDKCKTQKKRPSLEQISDALQQVASLYSRVFIVVDALDECQSGGCRMGLVKDLFDLKSKHRVNIFTTSRFIPEITKQFSNCLYRKIQATKEDIERYLDGQMRALSSFEDWSLQLQTEIKSAISDGVDGMYV